MGLQHVRSCSVTFFMLDCFAVFLKSAEVDMVCLYLASDGNHWCLVFPDCRRVFTASSLGSPKLVQEHRFRSTPQLAGHYT